MKVTRRMLGRMLAASASLPAIAMAEPSPQAADADENTRSAQAQLKSNAEQLAKIAVPMATEPAFRFRA